MKAIVICLVFLANFSFAEDYKHQLNYGVPVEFFMKQSYHPASYLRSFPVNSFEENLDKKSKIKLANLFVCASVSVREKYNQDYLIEVDVPIYRLLKKNFPELDKVEKGRPHFFLRDLADFLKDYYGVLNVNERSE